MLCLVAFVLSPSDRLMSSIECPSKWRSTNAARSRWLSADIAVVDAILDFGAQHQSLRCALPAVVDGVGAADLFEVRRVVSRFAVRPRPNQVDRAVHGDAVQPGAEVRPRLEAAQLLVGLQERLLHHVLGVRGAAGHPVRQPVDSAAVALDERPKRLAVSVARQRDGGGVRLRHPIA